MTMKTMELGRRDVPGKTRLNSVKDIKITEFQPEGGVVKSCHKCSQRYTPFHWFALQHGWCTAKIGVQVKCIQLLGVHLVHRRLHSLQDQHCGCDIVNHYVQLTNDKSNHIKSKFPAANKINTSKKRNKMNNVRILKGEVGHSDTAPR